MIVCIVVFCDCVTGVYGAAKVLFFPDMGKGFMVFGQFFLSRSSLGLVSVISRSRGWLVEAETMKGKRIFGELCKKCRKLYNSYAGKMLYFCTRLR